MKNSHANAARCAMLFLFLAGLATSLTACNTTEGFGKDVKSTGNSIEQSAKDSK